MNKPKFYMKCSKCKEEFEEKLLQSSHDIPKYIGGTDADGRHWLCEKCHKRYEWSIFIPCAGYIKNLSPEIKRRLRLIAEKVKGDFFK